MRRVFRADVDFAAALYASVKRHDRDSLFADRCRVVADIALLGLLPWLWWN